jgi:serine/threonine-protein kinase HipA
MTIEAVMSGIAYFHIPPARAKEILGEVSRAEDDCRKTGRGIGMTDFEPEPFADAFEHRERDAARKLL